ncbi:MAG TPA: CHAT domain-containing protein [Candidatus Angelobacter sp.]
MAAEVAPAHIARRTLQHVAQCDHCGPLLKSYREAFSEELSPEIAAMVEKTPSATAKAQQKLAREIARSIAIRKRDPAPTLWEKTRAWVATTGGRVTAGATAAAMAAIASIVWGPAMMDAWELRREEKLVAAAYAEKPPTPMRLTSVDYGDYKPWSKTLGDNDGIDLNRPVLLQAKTELAKKLKSGKKLDPRWFQIKGRLVLLSDPSAAKSAQEAFEEAQSSGLNDPSLDIDLAVSYFERAETGDGLNLARTIDLLERVLKHPKLKPEQRAVALFDLAIAYEKIQAWDLAAANWEKYLAEDRSSSPWVKEAQDHLTKAKEKLPAPKASDFRQPGFFLRHSADAKVLDDIEQFQEFAFGEWLPKAIDKPQSDYAQALALLARVMEQRHSDPWWKDFLDATGPAQITSAQSLSDAYVADQNDLHFLSLEQSRRAANTFAQNGNRPGELMAEFQEVYALQRIRDGTNCLARADLLSKSLRNTKYRWLQGQLALERAICANLSSDFDLVDSNLKESRRIAALAHFDFPELRLRVIGLDASMLRMRGKIVDAWKQSISGLEDYWAGSYSGERLLQFYSVMRQCAADIRAVNAAEALLRQSIIVLQAGVPQNDALRVLLQLRLANLLLEQGDSDGADKEADAARQLLARNRGDDGTARLYGTAARIELAAFELRRKQGGKALLELNQVADAISAKDIFLRLDFYRTLARAELQLNQPDNALSAYEKAVRITNEAFHALKEGEARLYWMQTTDEIFRGVVEALLARKDDERALAVWEWTKSRTFQSTNLPEVSNLVQSSAQDLREVLAVSKQNRIVYASLEEKLQIWTIRGRHVESRSIPLARFELAKRVREFVKNCSAVDSGLLSKANVQSEELYRLLLEPVVSLFSVTEIIAIEIDESMAALPLEALRNSDRRYFGEDYAFIDSPGLLVEKKLRLSSSLQPDDQLLVFDGSTLSDNLPGHEIATSAASNIEAQLKLFRAPVSVAAFRSELQKTAGLSFFGHAVPNGTGAGLKLGPDSLLAARELDPKLLSNMKIVVLAACSSGSSEKGLLDSGSLVRAFLASGVPTIVSSRWNVESRSTAQFVQNFYAHLASESAPFAMRDARREMRSLNASDWAGFTLTGRSN